MTTKRRKRHSPEQIVRKLRDADAMLNAGKVSIGDSKPASDRRFKTRQQELESWSLRSRLATGP
jgi:hypothetical protein